MISRTQRTREESRKRFR